MVGLLNQNISGKATKSPKIDPTEFQRMIRVEGKELGVPARGEVRIHVLTCCVKHNRVKLCVLFRGKNS